MALHSSSMEQSFRFLSGGIGAPEAVSGGNCERGFDMASVLAKKSS